MPGYLSHGGAYVQTLELRPGDGGLQLVFTSTMLNGFSTDKSASDDVATVVLLEHLREGKFSYRGLDENAQLMNWGSSWADPHYHAAHRRHRSESECRRPDRLADDDHSVGDRRHRRAQHEHPGVWTVKMRTTPCEMREKGVALILVIWVTALMAILLGSFALIARTENVEARHTMFDTTTARYAAIAGLERAVYELRNPDMASRWAADGRAYEFPYAGAQVSVAITDESGKIDLNLADSTILVPLFPIRRC